MRDNPSQRPRLDIPRTLGDYIAEVLALAGVISGILLLVLVWTELPDQIPRHFGFDGEPTAWSGRWSAVFPIGIAVAIYIGLTTLNRYPHIFNYPVTITEQNAAIQYRLARSMVTWLKALCVWLMTWIVWTQARVAMTDAEEINPLLIVAFIVAIHLVLGIYFYRSYRNRDRESNDDRVAPDGD